MIQELSQQGFAVLVQYNVGIIVFLLIPFYGIYHKFDRDYFIQKMKELWHEDRSLFHPIRYFLIVPILFLIYGYKTAWDRYNTSIRFAGD
jgi:hypothetical protein